MAAVARRVQRTPRSRRSHEPRGGNRARRRAVKHDTRCHVTRANLASTTEKELGHEQSSERNRRAQRQLSLRRGEVRGADRRDLGNRLQLHGLYESRHAWSDRATRRVPIAVRRAQSHGVRVGRQDGETLLLQDLRRHVLRPRPPRAARRRIRLGELERARRHRSGRGESRLLRRPAQQLGSRHCATSPGRYAPDARSAPLTPNTAPAAAAEEPRSIGYACAAGRRRGAFVRNLAHSRARQDGAQVRRHGCHEHRDDHRPQRAVEEQTRYGTEHRAHPEHQRRIQ